MKIGIFTFHAPCNFGANLQAYSSYCFFLNFGHEVNIINYLRKNDYEYENKVPKEQYYAHQRFIQEKLPLTELVSTVEELRLLVKNKGFDLIIVGADAVWRYKNGELTYFMEWLFRDKMIANIPVVAMSAAHMGNGFKRIPVKQRIAIKDCLSQFKYISVRDFWTMKIINRDIFKGQEFVRILNPDPVFLLDKYVQEDWLNGGIKSKSYFLMTLPKNWLSHSRKEQKRRRWFNEFKNIVKGQGYQLIELPLPEGISGMDFDYTIPYPIDPLQWFLWIKNARAFCGLRFHAIVSSFASGTPFFSIDSYGSVSLISRILTEVGLYKIARLLDTNSKIRNLLKPTPFAANRVTRDIENVKPYILFCQLESMEINVIEEVREVHIELFEKNMSEMLNIVFGK